MTIAIDKYKVHGRIEPRVPVAIAAVAACANGSSPDMFGMSGDMMCLLSGRRHDQPSRLKQLKAFCTELAIANGRLGRVDAQEGILLRSAKACVRAADRETGQQCAAS